MSLLVISAASHSLSVVALLAWGLGMLASGWAWCAVCVPLDGLATTGDWPLDHPHPEHRPGGAHQGMPGPDWLTEEILSSDWARPERGAGR